MKPHLLRSTLLPALVCALLVAGVLGVTGLTRAALRQSQAAPLQSHAVQPDTNVPSPGGGGNVCNGWPYLSYGSTGTGKITILPI